MKVDGERTYWGAGFDEETDEKTKTLLGKDMEMHKEGENADQTRGRKEAVQILQDPQREGRLAMQTMLMHKQAHGSGVDLDFPDTNQREEAMVGYDTGHMVQVYADGSYTTPTKRWAALGGYGVWVPDWNRNAETIEAREEKNHSGAA